MVELRPVTDPVAALHATADHDAVVYLATPHDRDLPAVLAGALDPLRAVDARADSQLTLLPAERLPGKRLVVSPTGPLRRDHDDVRRFADAARAGLRRARDAGARSPLLLVGTPPNEDPRYRRAVEVAVLGALSGLWEPLEAREALGDATCEPVQALAVGALGAGVAGSFEVIAALETGLRLARDLCGTEPERMAPPRFAQACVAAFTGTAVDVDVISDRSTLERDYPLLSAVARASFGVERHRPSVIRLEYRGSGPIERTLLFAGKGLTYDTGGADLKAGGVMAGMSRDKGGGAAVAGFLAAVARLAPKGVRVIAEIGAVRNSIGSDCYVTDEIIKSHAGVRVRIGNTDAEGRLVLADLLSHLRVAASTAPSPRLFSVATLTGHAVRAAGPYSIALDNGPARALATAEELARVGDLLGDPFEVSRLRREDWDFVAPRSRADDVLSCNNAPSTMTNRGHQFPMAFLAIAAGLAGHGSDAAAPLPFTHIDIGGSATEGSDWQHGRPTGRPVVAMVGALLGLLT
ncbi:MAG: leucyl aminopeptidase family protein [Planctomycetota bacterium]